MPRLLQFLRRTLRRYPALKTARQSFSRLRDFDLHAVMRASRTGEFRLYQPRTTTSEDRYPDLFDRIAELLADTAEPHILSFGCSGGEEVRALRKRMPHARIVGVDVNPRALARAQKKDRNPLSAYHLADSPPAGQMFDVVLALAVFRHGQLEDDCPSDAAQILPFADVAEGVTRLDAVLRPGGWLAYGNAHFRFRDMPVAGRYRADAFRGHPRSQSLVYGPDNRRMYDAADPDILFEKIG